MNLWDSVHRGLEKASNEAGRIARAQRARVAIDKLGRQISEQEAGLLNTTMQLFGANMLTQPELLPLCQDIIQLRQQLNQLQQELQQLQAQNPQASMNKSVPPTPSTLPPTQFASGPSYSTESENPYSTVDNGSFQTVLPSSSYYSSEPIPAPPPPPEVQGTMESAPGIQPPPPPPSGSLAPTFQGNRTCPQCGTFLQANNAFCQNCGAFLQNMATSQSTMKAESLPGFPGVSQQETVRSSEYPDGSTAPGEGDPQK